MKVPPRLLPFVRPRRLIVAALYMFCAYAFANNLDPTPRFEVQTEAKSPSLLGESWGISSASLSAEHLDDAGKQLTVARRSGHRGGHSALEVWDAETGDNVTPRFWYETEWQCLLCGGEDTFDDRKCLLNLVYSNTGRDLLHNNAAWAALGQKLSKCREKSLDDLRRSGEKLNDHRRLYPPSLRVSSDGRFISYVVREGIPLFGSDSQSRGDGTVIDDVRAGGQIAILRDVTSEVTVAPGGLTAVSRNYLEDHCWSDGPWLTLWDLETPCCRAELLIPDRSFDVEFGPDGRYVFAKAWGRFGPTALLWWDTRDGHKVGHIQFPRLYCFVNGGRQVFTYSSGDSALHSWDVATGEELDEWQPKLPPNRRAYRLSRSGNDRFLSVTHYPHGRGGGKASPLTEKVSDWLAERVSKNTEYSDHRRVLVLDAVNRRVVGDVPGVSAVVSENDRYLASIDADGIVRVWELPLRRPWLRGFAYSVALVFGSWLVLEMLGKVRRRLWPPHVD